MVQPMQFSPITFDEANPGFTGMRYGADLASKLLSNEEARTNLRYLKPRLEEELKQLRLNTQILEPKAQYAPQMAKAGLDEVLANIALRKSQQQESGIRAAADQLALNIARQTAPYEIEKAKESMFTDPMMKKLVEYQYATKTGDVTPETFAAFGITGPDKLSQTLGTVNTKATNLLHEKTWDKGQLSAVDLSNDATAMKQFIDQFSSAYDKSKLKGTVLGNVPSSGIASIPYAAAAKAAGSSLSNEQLADNAAQNMQSLLVKLMRTNKLTNYELQFTGGLKLSRKLDPKTVNTLQNFLTAKSDRLNEHEDFLQSARDNGLSYPQAEAQWTRYENEKPIFDFTNNKVNQENAEAWNNYLTPGYTEKTKPSSPSGGGVNQSGGVKTVDGQNYIKINGKWYRSK